MRAEPEPVRGDDFGVVREGQAPGSDPAAQALAALLHDREQLRCLIGDHALHVRRERRLVPQRQVWGVDAARIEPATMSRAGNIVAPLTSASLA